MSFCVLILGGSSAWSLDDWNKFFSLHEIQPEEIIPSIFSLGSVCRNIIPDWAPIPSITCHVYLTSSKDIHKLLRLNGKSYKDRILHFETYNPESSNLTKLYKESSYLKEQTYQQSNQYKSFIEINNSGYGNSLLDSTMDDDEEEEMKIKSIESIIQSNGKRPGVSFNMTNLSKDTTSFNINTPTPTSSSIQ